MTHRLAHVAVTALWLSWVSAASAQAPAPPEARGRGGFQNQPRSPEVLADGKVTFRIAAPDASTVTVSGDWPEGRNLPMTKDANGIWSATVGPLKPELWAYTFSVNGVSTLDPGNVKTKRDGRRYANTLVMPGPESSLYDVNDVPHGTLAAVWYRSAALKMTRRMYVYTPPGYEDGNGRFPVLYLLHGAGGDEDAWNSNGKAREILDNLIARGKAKPMIVVMTNGNADQAAAPDIITPPPPGQTAAGPESFASRLPLFADSVVSDVIPYVEKHYRVIADRENRAIAGLSMGGAQALFAGLHNLDKFAWVGSYSGAFVLWPGVRAAAPAAPPAAAPAAPPAAAPGQGPAPRGPGGRESLDLEAVAKTFPTLNAETSKRLRLFYISCGLDDFLLVANQQFKQWLRSKNVAFLEVETPGYGHVWSFWRISLADMASRLFKPDQGAVSK